MHFNVVLFGVKNASRELLAYTHENLMKVDLIVTVDEAVTKKNHIAGFASMDQTAQDLGIELFKAKDYTLKDKAASDFFKTNTFDIGICANWQRLIPESVLNRFKFGVFGFHGSAGYLPFGRGRSPMNWSILQGDKRFINHLFKYDEKADSPNVFTRTAFEITPFDDAKSVSFKNLLTAKTMLKDLFEAYKKGKIDIRTKSNDPDTWYGKRTPEDGKIDFTKRTDEIYNLVRSVSDPFPGAFAFNGKGKVIIWDAVPFDRFLDFSNYTPGEVIDVFENCAAVRTVDGSLLIRKYTAEAPLAKGDVLS